MNPIQQELLRKLTLNTEQKYSELKPIDLDPKLFNYHLTLLRDKELVIKKEDGMYRLSAQGQLFIERLNGRNMKTQIQPRVATMIICQNEKSEYLLYTRSIEPFKGKIGFPWGKAHVEETVQQSAHREILEWSGFDEDLRAIGVVDMMIYQHEELISHTVFHLYRGTTTEQIHTKKVFWQQVSEKDDLSGEEYLIWFKDIFSFLGEKEFFSKELIYRV